MVQLACFGQDRAQPPAPQALIDSASSDPNLAPVTLPDDPQQSSRRLAEVDPGASLGRPTPPQGSRLSYYLTETYWNPSALTAPAFRAGLRMANPPGTGATAYPAAWRRGAEAFGRNLGDALAARVSAHTAQFLTGEITREDPFYTPSASRGFLTRSAHAIAYTFIDRSDSGRLMPAVSNFAGAAAGGFVGNAYLPAGFRDLTHAGQRSTLQLGTFAAGNLFREFAPQIPAPLRIAISLIGR
jgi:hypothetical protein